VNALPIFDTHAHLDLPQFDSDRAAVIQRLESGTFPGGIAPKGLEDLPVEVVGVIIPGIDAASCRKALEMSAISDLLHVAVAIHPNHTAETTDENWRNIVELARRDDVVAIGETGLDRYWDDTPIDVQIDFFHRHIELSLETGKPILIHCRDAWEDMLPILKRTKGLSGVMHAFSGNTEQMLACVELGLFVSYSGSVTYRNAKFSPLWDAAQKTPSDRLLIETDAPFMTPHPLRGKLPRNEPTLAALVALRLAELRDEPIQTIAETTARNALDLLRITGGLALHAELRSPSGGDRT